MFGVGIVQARLIIFLFWLTFIVLLAGMAYRLGGGLSMFLVLVLAAFLPNFFDFGLKVMGEIPALVFLLLGLWALSKNEAFWGAMLLGFSVLTKLNFLFSLGTLVLFYGLRWIGALFKERGLNKDLQKTVKQTFALLLRDVIKSGCAVASGFSLPIVTWEAIRLFVLGWMEYWQNWGEFLRLLGILPGTRQLLSSSSFTTRLLTVGIPYKVSDRFILGMGIFFLGALMLWGLWNFRSGVLHTEAKQEITLYWLLNASGLVSLVWWLFGKSDWWRHLLPGYLLWGLVVCITLVRWIKGTANRRWLERWRGVKSFGLGLVLFFLVFYPVGLQFRLLEFGLKQNYTCQNSLAQQIRAMSEQKAIFGYWGWYQSPELSFLSQKSFYDVAQPATRMTFAEMTARGYQPYVIVSQHQEMEAKETLAEEGPLLGQVVKEMCGYKVYQYVGK